MSEENSAPSFAVRLLPRAVDDIDKAVRYLEETAGDAIAEAWRTGLQAEIARLKMPRQFPLIAEGRHFPYEVRQLLYRRTADSAIAYRVLFLVEDSTPLDGPRVRVFHDRHGSRRPLTAKEARSLRQDW